MRVHEFLNLVAQETRAALPPQLHAFRTWKRYTLVQMFYAQRRIHYEVWVRGNVKSLEIGLHCEADAKTNARLLQVIQNNMFEIYAELGDKLEAEQWTKSWTRVHELMPYSSLDQATARACGQRVAAMITVLQPMLERPIVERHTKSRAAPVDPSELEASPAPRRARSSAKSSASQSAAPAKRTRRKTT
jgi:hypothetical protein